LGKDGSNGDLFGLRRSLFDERRTGLGEFPGVLQTL
jgi:hypothetical protein